MVAVERENVYWGTVNVTQGLEEMIAVKVCSEFYMCTREHVALILSHVALGIAAHMVYCLSYLNKITWNIGRNNFQGFSCECRCGY
jgi:hypothetical protein